MVTKNNKLHIICWVCGTSKDFEIKLKEEWEIYLTCNNCATLTELNEELENSL